MDYSRCARSASRIDDRCRILCADSDIGVVNRFCCTTSIFTFDDIHVIHALPTHHYIHGIVSHIFYFVSASHLTIPQIYPISHCERKINCAAIVCLVYHLHVASDACVPSRMRHGFCVGGSIPSQRPFGVVRCCSSAVSRRAFDSLCRVTCKMANIPC